MLFLCPLQLIQRAKGRAVRLQEALRNIQGNAALLEELLAWLTDAQVLLATKERDPIPDDLAVVDTLVKEHVVSVIWSCIYTNLTYDPHSQNIKKYGLIR